MLWPAELPVDTRREEPACVLVAACVEAGNARAAAVANTPVMTAAPTTDHRVNIDSRARPLSRWVWASRTPFALP